MYYKIVNQDCEVYQKLKQLRIDEQKIEEENLKAINEKLGELKYDMFLGNRSQQSFTRVTSYEGFIFTNPEKVDKKIWKEKKGEAAVFIPNLRTKKGREMQEFLLNGLKKSWYSKVFEILNLEELNGRFKFPFVSLENEIILVYLGDNHLPQDENLIEITTNEFYRILRDIKD